MSDWADFPVLNTNESQDGISTNIRSINFMLDIPLKRRPKSSRGNDLAASPSLPSLAFLPSCSSFDFLHLIILLEFYIKIYI